MLNPETLLLIRAIENIIIFITLFVGAISLLISKENGITKSLASALLMGSFYVGLVLLSSFIDVCNNEKLRNYLLNYWVIICGLIIWATLWLGWELRKNKDG